MRVEDNELLTRVGPGTPMGNLMRQYWLPAMKSTELTPDGDPVRFRLLCEDLIAFRTGSGDIGILDHRCPHRCASLFYGRNEDEGLRCVYHGWKFDVNGNCVDMPSEPAETDFKQKVKAVATYKAQECNGLVWIYMGQRKEPPPLPMFPANQLPADGDYQIRMFSRECNWLQALEGDLDTVHVGFLHAGGAKLESFAPGTVNYYRFKDASPKYDVRETEYGTVYNAYRPAGDDNTYNRIGQFLMPFWSQTPPQPIENMPHARAWVPLDDNNCMAISLPSVPNPNIPVTSMDKDGKPLPGVTEGQRYLPNTTDFLGRWRLTPNRANDHEIDRDFQKNGSSYTGIRGITQQDHAVTESMGYIEPREIEHLGTSDGMIIATRRRLLDAARDLEKNGTVPPGAETPEVYHKSRSGWCILPKQADWLEELRKVQEGEEANIIHLPLAVLPAE